MKKNIILLTGALIICTSLQAQKKPVTDKVVAASEKANKKIQQISDASNRIKEQADQVGANAQNIAKNVKAVIKIFEPILQHFKKKKKPGNDAVVVNTTQAKSDPNTGYPQSNNNTGTTSQQADANTNSGMPQPEYNNNGSGNTSSPQPNYDPGIPENQNYNTDKTANLGNQNNLEHPNFFDAFKGEVTDGFEAQLHPENIDLVFLADQYGGYVLATPVFLKNSDPGFHYENVVREWSNVNESEVALTKMSIADFEKIKQTDAPKFYSVIKQTSGYASFYQSFTEKLKGKVFAVRSEMEGRMAYALIAVIDQIGTYGASGHLKIKVKAAGIDNNGDGYADVTR